MKVTFKNYEKPSSFVIEYNSNYNWRNFIREIKSTNECEVYVCLEGKTKISFSFCTEGIEVSYHGIPEGCEEFSYVSKTTFGRTNYKLRLTKNTTKNVLSKYIESVLKEYNIKDINVNVFLDNEIESKIK